MAGSAASQTQRGGSSEGGPWQFLAAKLPAEDLTAAARAGMIPEAVGWPTAATATPRAGDPFDRLARALYRRTDNHVLITGHKGVGKTTLVFELARRAAAGRISFLSNRRFLWLDARHVGPEESRGCFETILMACEGERDIVLCLDSIGSLLRRPQGGDNKSLLRAATHRPGLQVVGVLDAHEYQDLIGCDAGLAELFTRIELEEPGEEATIEIARRAAIELSAEYELPLSESVVRRAIAFTSSYLLNESHPAKAIKVLRRCCEDADYERTQLGRERADVTEQDVVRTISGITGIPEETISGEAGGANFEEALRSVIVGQDEAVREVASELQLIRAHYLRVFRVAGSDRREGPESAFKPGLRKASDPATPDSFSG
ncbi:MAG: hypothetical protein IT428_24375, partial [Planctomycetaceae bacterium]|nr:hypothetical protein [Planctomycetaceae bacterium]